MESLMLFLLYGRAGKMAGGLIHKFLDIVQSTAHRAVHLGVADHVDDGGFAALLGARQGGGDVAASKTRSP
jgi:hypothetical protein